MNSSFDAMGGGEMPSPPCLVYTIAEVANKLGIGLNQAYAAARKQEIPAIKIGGRWLVPKVQFDRWISGN
jgi:excisionase family DNA binding protein